MGTVFYVGFASCPLLAGGFEVICTVCNLKYSESKPNLAVIAACE